MLQAILKFFDSRHSLRTRLGLVLGVAALLLMLTASLIHGYLQQRERLANTGTALQNIASQLSEQLDREIFQLYEHFRHLAAIPFMYSQTGPQDRPGVQQAWRALLQYLRDAHSNLSWIGLLDLDGRFVTVSGAISEHANMSGEDWFSHAKIKPYVGLLQAASRVDFDAQAAAHGILITLPVYDSAEELTGVLAAKLAGDWMLGRARAIRAAMVPRLAAEVLIVAPDGTVLLGPTDLVKRQIQLPDLQSSWGYQRSTWPDAQDYLSTYWRSSRYESFPSMRWLIVLRQPISSVLTLTREAWLRALPWGALLGFILALLAWYLARWITTPLQALSQAVDRIRQGDPDAAIPVPPYQDEIAHISTVFAELLGDMTQSSEGLKEANARLKWELYERQQTELMFRASEAELRLILDNVPAAISYYDKNDICHYGNSRYCELFGWNQEEIVGKPLCEVVNATVYRSIQDQTRKAKNGEPVTYGRSHTSRTGRQSELEISLVPHCTKEGLVAGLYVLIRDVTDQKNAERTLRDSEQRYMLAAHGAADGMWDWNPCSRAFYVSPRLLSILGYPEDYPLRDTDAWLELVHPADRRRYNFAIGRHLKRGSDYLEIEYRVRAQNGEYRWLHTRGLAVWDEQGKPLRMAGSSTDITARKQAEFELLLTTDRLNLALESATLAIWDLNIQTGEIYLSKEWAVMLGQEPHPTQTSIDSLKQLVHPQEREFLPQLLTAMKNGQRVECNIEYRLRHHSGAWLWIHSRGRVVERDTQGYALRMTGTNANITDRKQAESRIKYLATRDSLTDLPNRALLADRLQQLIGVAQRENRPFAVLFLDLDRFKTINDSLGHHIGDLLLRETAKRLQSCLRDEDTVARQGGDEFIILLPHVAGSPDVYHAVERILRVQSQPFKIEGHELVVTTSIGIAIYPEDGQDVSTLLRNADTAMYHAKEHGRNSSQFFLERMNETAKNRLELEGALRSAIKCNELTLYYQPQVDLASHSIVGYEVLVRWRHPDHGLILPTQFIPIAEDSGLVMELGEWVLLEACRQARFWPHGDTPMRIAVNVSMWQLKQINFAERVERALSVAGLEPHYLELEITESALVEQLTSTLATLEALRIMGVRLVIDDFGTGYSSLAYLKRLPISKMKIDRSFVCAVNSDPDDAAIMRSIIALGHSLGKKVVAEGVETPEQLALLRELKCDEGQGYLLGRPCPANELAIEPGAKVINLRQRIRKPAD